MTASHQHVVAYLQNLGDREIAARAQIYFKTAKGEYGYGDKFLGIRVPVLRRSVKAFGPLSLAVLKHLLKSQYHEIRLFALLALVRQFAQGDDTTQQQIYRLYLQHTRYINNWDLVDSSAPQIVGAWLCSRDKSILYELAHSECLWERRIAMMATAYFIRLGQFRHTFKLADILLTDEEDLIHKAVGWMLREIGKRDQQVAENYLRKNYQKMPRIMLRYAIEKMPLKRKQAYLKGQI